MALSIKIKNKKLPEPVDLPPPGERRGTILKEKNQPLPDLRIYIHNNILKTMHKRAHDADDYKIGGFYLNDLYRYKNRHYVDITVQIPTLKTKNTRTQLTFSNKTQKPLHKTIEKQKKSELVLGWYHTHPGYSVFLSN